MSGAFDYLLEDGEREFFQRVAEERAAPPARPAKPLEKTGSQASEREKLASELEADWFVLEHAGHAGVDLGMTKGAMARLERLAHDPRLHRSPEIFPALFGKFAARAIEADLDAALCQVSAGLSQEKQAEARRAVAALGVELAQAAQETEAKLAGFFSTIGKGLGRAVGGAGGAVGALRSTTRGIGGAIAKPLSEAVEGFRAGRAAGAAKRLQGIEREMSATRGAYESATNAGARGFHGGALRSLESQRAGLQAKMEPGRAQGGAFHAPSAERAGKIDPASTDDLPAKAPSKSPSPRFGLPGSSDDAGRLRAEHVPDAPAKRPSSTAEHADEGRSKSSVSPAEEPPSTKPADEAKPEDAPAGKLTDTFRKLHSKGFSSLSRAEKHQLLATGVGAVGAHRILTGRDLLTGEQSD